MKEYLSRKGQPFTERDIVSDPQAIVELEKLGYLTTPVVVVDGQVVVGFNRAQLDSLLG
ncbi:MAG: glutaredoxin domain-containing protein [Anaerolineae bacterium]